MERKLNLFGHICRMKDNRQVKEVDVWNGGRRIKERKTVKRMVG